jgi:hypothetical protein
MLVADPQNDTKPKEIHLPVEGVAVHQPLHKIVAKVAELKREGRKVITRMQVADVTDTQEHEKLKTQLINTQNELTRWGVSLFAHMPYKYPPSTFSLSD